VATCPSRSHARPVLSANKDSPDVTQRQLSYYAYPAAGMCAPAHFDFLLPSIWELAFYNCAILLCNHGAIAPSAPVVAPQAVLRYCVLAFGVTMMLSCALAVVGINKRSAFWMRQSNRLGSLVTCLSSRRCLPHRSAVAILAITRQCFPSHRNRL
jgi:hypothetical protein